MLLVCGSLCVCSLLRKVSGGSCQTECTPQQKPAPTHTSLRTTLLVCPNPSAASRPSNPVHRGLTWGITATQQSNPGRFRSHPKHVLKKCKKVLNIYISIHLLSVSPTISSSGYNCFISIYLLAVFNLLLQFFKWKCGREVSGKHECIVAQSSRVWFCNHYTA